MRKLAIPIILVLLVSLTACATKKQDRVLLEKESVVNQEDSVLMFSQELGDAMVAYYLGRDYPEEYESLLLQVNQLADAIKMIYFDDSVSNIINQRLSEVVLLSMTLSGSPVYTTSNESVDFALDAEASGGDDIEPNDKALKQMRKLQKQMFPNGTAPNIQPLDDYGEISSEFTLWFMEQAKKQGMLDARIEVDYDGNYYVSSGDCSVSRGGTTFDVFGIKYEMSKSVIGLTQDETRTSKKYDMLRDSFRLYDTGWYEAIYRTADKVSQQDTVCITVSFRHTTMENTEGMDELELYLFGITDLQITVQ